MGRIGMRRLAELKLKLRWTICLHHHHPLRRNWKRRRRKTSSVWPIRSAPPLPPKRITPSPKKGLSLETQPSLDEEEEAVPVKGILSLQAVDGNIRVVRNEIQVPEVPGWSKESRTT